MTSCRDPLELPPGTRPIDVAPASANSLPNADELAPKIGRVRTEPHSSEIEPHLAGIGQVSAEVVPNLPDRVVDMLTTTNTICTARRDGVDSGGAKAPAPLGKSDFSTGLKSATWRVVRGASKQANLPLDANLLTPPPVPFPTNSQNLFLFAATRNAHTRVSTDRYAVCASAHALKRCARGGAGKPLVRSASAPLPAPWLSLAAARAVHFIMASTQFVHALTPYTEIVDFSCRANAAGLAKEGDVSPTFLRNDSSFQCRWSRPCESNQWTSSRDLVGM